MLKKYFNFVNDSAHRQNESRGDLNPYYIIILFITELLLPKKTLFWQDVISVIIKELLSPLSPKKKTLFWQDIKCDHKGAVFTKKQPYLKNDRYQLTT